MFLRATTPRRPASHDAHGDDGPLPTTPTATTARFPRRPRRRRVDAVGRGRASSAYTPGRFVSAGFYVISVHLASPRDPASIAVGHLWQDRGAPGRALRAVRSGVAVREQPQRVRRRARQHARLRMRAPIPARPRSDSRDGDGPRAGRCRERDHVPPSLAWRRPGPVRAETRFSVHAASKSTDSVGPSTRRGARVDPGWTATGPAVERT